ncbi:hypothetical protein F383_33249 [Gossypium arboreum]|uniref:Uncharacterized protein n=1 Tax=Gossypium arboreum TaxID=29729 RepID=A0A0B0N6C9_GOSAR|nr:hypothetical protein F383_33249 [Gossypium arboreum]
MRHRNLFSPSYQTRISIVHQQLYGSTVNHSKTTYTVRKSPI